MEEKAKQWDRAAAEFQRTYELGINPYLRACFEFWTERGMIFPGCRVLDVGCGVGKYGVLLTARGCEVTLTDISEKMLSFARRNMETAFPGTSCRILCCDFDEADLESEAFSPRFDFCLSTMSPAIHDKNTLEKLNLLSRGWCFIAGFTDSDAVLRRQILEAVGFFEAQTREEKPELQHTTMAQLTEMVRELGYHPETVTVPYDWTDRRTPEQQSDLMWKRYYQQSDKSEEYRQKTLAYLMRTADPDGMVADAVHTQVQWLFWKAKKTEL